MLVSSTYTKRRLLISVKLKAKRYFLMGTDGDVFAFEFFDDAGIDFVLFVFGRHVVAVEVAVS